MRNVAVNLPALQATLERVLALDETRTGLQKLIAYIDGHAEEIKQQRKANGLENRK